MFKRILIANRGEIAVRVMKACKQMGIETVAVYSKADQDSPHIKFADKAVCIGPSQSGLSYLNMEAVLQAALQNQCHALHPGFGFLSENELFDALCEQYKITFIGPPPKAIRCMGDKALARRTMKKAGLDIIPGSQDTLSSLQEARQFSQEIGFPVLLKATAGGGGKGMRICHNLEDLEQNFVQASCEAEKAFGNPALYMEKFIPNGHHIEFQIMADSYGNVVHLGERECSVQRNYQKLLEESPSPNLSRETRDAVGKRLIPALQNVGYRNAGTVEFLMGTDQLYFMEMNTRLQVEHPVTEMVTGIDIVQEQIRIAANHPLSLEQNKIQWNGHAIECRINAEDPDKNFQPKPGKITKFQPPLNVGPGKVRVDTFIEEGYTIPPFYDSMICKLIVWGENRQQAIETMKNALHNFVIEGVPTTIPFHLKLLDNQNFQSGNYNTGIVKQVMQQQS